MAEQNYTYTNESFSGCDMVATILMPNVGKGGRTAYTIGELQTISYSIHMDRQPVRSIGNINVKDYVMGPRTIAGSLVFAVFNKHFANKIMKDINGVVDSGYAFLIDEIPPFDIVITAANEYGLRSRMVIYGVRLVNEGQVMSINDVYTENTYQFVATDLEYLTDENQYTSGSRDGRGLYKIVEKGITTYNNNISYKYKSAKKTSPFRAELNYRVTDVATAFRQGVVELWVAPTKKIGSIKITGHTVSKEIDMTTGLNKNNRAVVQLPAGEYSAVWENSADKSNTISFRIAQDIIVDNTVLPAPIIEEVGDTSISIYSNVKNHTRLIYEDKNKQTFSIKLTGRRAKILNLEAASVYKIATCDEAMNSISDYVKVMTLAYGFDHYKNFLDYLNYNKTSLKVDNFDYYTTVVMEGKRLAFSGVKYRTIADSFIDVNKYFTDKLNNLDSIDFPGSIEFKEEVDRLKTLISIATEVTYIATITNNNSIYGYNYDVMAVEPPVPETDDLCTNTFLINYNIESLDFFRQLSNTQQFAKTITKNNFRDIGDGYACLFNGRPGARYYTYAVNKYGFRSPRVDFYALSDGYRSESLEAMIREIEAKNYDITKAKYLNSYRLDSTLTEAEANRVLTEILKSADVKNISTPILKKADNASIEIELNEPEEFLINNNFRAVICEIGTALMNVTKYKISARNSMEFTVYKHGIRPNKTYAIWIENSDEQQVSDSITVITKAVDETSEAREHDINRIFIEEIINSLRTEFNSNKLMCSTLDMILYKNENEVSNTKADVLEKILNDITTENSIENNLFDILYSFFKVYLDMTYSITENFFNVAPMLNKNTQEILISDDCLMYKFNIGAAGVTKLTQKISANEKVKINDNTSTYTVMFFSNNELSKRSGFVIANNFSSLHMTYKMQVKVGE